VDRPVVTAVVWSHHRLHPNLRHALLGAMVAAQIAAHLVSLTKTAEVPETMDAVGQILNPDTVKGIRFVTVVPVRQHAIVVLLLIVADVGVAVVSNSVRTNSPPPHHQPPLPLLPHYQYQVMSPKDPIRLD